VIVASNCSMNSVVIVVESILPVHVARAYPSENSIDRIG
jgi:hypothetical protein